MLELITSRAKRLTAAQAELFQNDVRPAMAQAGIEITDWKSLNQEERDKLTRYFRYRVYPVLTPLAVDPSHPFPYISRPVAEPGGYAAQPRAAAKTTSPASNCPTPCHDSCRCPGAS